MKITVLALLALATALPSLAQDASAGSASPTLQQRDTRYKLGLDDVLAINFALSPELSESVTVQPDGYINLQSTHSILVQGLTLPEVVVAIKAAYAGILHDPLIAVDLKDFQKPLFTVLGQVAHPGQFEIRRDTTLAEGMAIGGGLAPTSKTQVLLYRRINGSNTLECHEYNLKRVLQGKDVNEQPHLQAGDIVFVPEKFITKFKKYVPYSGPSIGFDPFGSNIVY